SVRIGMGQVGQRDRNIRDRAGKARDRNGGWIRIHAWRPASDLNRDGGGVDERGADRQLKTEQGPTAQRQKCPPPRTMPVNRNSQVGSHGSNPATYTPAIFRKKATKGRFFGWLRG